MKVYAIAKEIKECYSHGSYGDELTIPQFDCYGGNCHFAPVFKNATDAYEYLNNDKFKYHEYKVVELELVDYPLELLDES